MSPAPPTAPHGALSVTAEPRGTSGIDRRPRLATYVVASIVVVVFAGTALGNATTVLQNSVTVLQAAYGVGCVVALVAIQLLYFSRPATELDSTRSRLVLVGQAGLVYVPILTFELAWLGLIEFLAGSVLLVLRPRHAWPLVAAIVGSVGLLEWVLGARPLTIVYGTTGAMFYALVIYLLTRLARMVNELHVARTELALRAVSEQRLAFARDTHDLLGLSLSDIALKGELVHRLMRRSAESARHELTAMTDVAQRTLSDVRSVARSYREMSLEKESRTAESLLTASDIAVRMHLDQGVLPAQARRMISKVLREGVTNVLRFSDVERCEISIRHDEGRVSLEIVNDGVADGDLPIEPGDAMSSLTEEVAALGGTVTAESADGRFRLRLELPLPEGGALQAAELRRESRAEARRIRDLLTAVFCLMGAGAAIHLLYLTTAVWEIALCIGYLAALLALQIAYFNRPTVRLRSPQTYALLFVQACLIYLPLLPMGATWVSLPGLLAGCALLTLPPLAGWTVFALSTAGYISLQISFGATAFDTIFYGVATVISGLTTFGLIWLIRLVTELDSTRKRLAEMAVAEERLRFARDLHDLLGMTLSAIALKCELTSRVLMIDRDRAAEELQEILGLTRQALSDVRSVASGNRELSLENESRSARSVLTAADVRVRMEMLQEDLPAPVRTVLAVVLREGVTNVLRHSSVESCEISVRRTGEGVCLDIVNDGVEGEAVSEPVPVKTEVMPLEAPGSGIENMSHRVSNLGGELTAGVEEDGRFRLRAVVPVPV